MCVAFLNYRKTLQTKQIKKRFLKETQLIIIKANYADSILYFTI